jgi:SAM-dependent methyltransferase
MAWWFEVVESRHELQNPTSVEKIRLLGERLGLGPRSHVLDMACGRGGPALVLAQTFGCRVTGVEQSEAFLSAAKSRAAEAGVKALVDLVLADGKEFPIEPGRYDAALCLGASFVWGGLEQTVAALAPGVRGGGFVAVGEPYWRTWPLPDGFEPEEGYDFLALPETIALFETAGVDLVTLIDSTTDDWDRYESLHWHALEEWLHANPDHREAEQFRRMGRDYRDAYVRWLRDLLGWAIFVGRKR